MILNFKVVSDSMHPVIKINDLLQLEPAQNSLKRFDIILFKRNSVLVTHYIWKNQIAFNNSLITRSLKNIYRDEEPVNLSEIVGVVSNYQIPALVRFKVLALCFFKGALS